MNRDPNCVFCSSKFPEPYQLVSDLPNYWLFISNRNPHTNYHCLIVLKAKVIDEIGHISDLSDERLKPKHLQELGILLNKACISIKASDSSSIEKILIVSLNTGEDSKHLHFHLIPKRKWEQVKHVNNPCIDGGGMFFLARKEIVGDTLFDFLESTTGDKTLTIKIKETWKKKIEKNTKKLRKNFKWP